MNVEIIHRALQCGRASCECVRPRGRVHCPAHDDEHPSLKVWERNGRINVKCWARCSKDDVIRELTVRGLYSAENHPRSTRLSRGSKPQAVTVVTALQPLTATDLAAAKKLDLGVLRAAGVRDTVHNERRCVSIPYLSEDGHELATRYRLALEGPDRFRWKKESKTLLYGLHRLEQIRQHRWILLVEGESDCWTAWQYEIPALGIPGKTTFRSEWASDLTGLKVYLWQEPDAEDLTDRVLASIPDLRVIIAPPGTKDLNEAQVAGHDIPSLIESLRAKAPLASAITEERRRSQIRDLYTAAEPILNLADPLGAVEDEIRALGYGGDITPALIVYLAVTSRLLSMRHGSMPVHTLLMGPPSAGKSWTVNLILSLLPEDAYHAIDAGSPRALLYDDADLRHRALIFGEADSLPAGEDNPAASAIRVLLQDHRVRYDVTVRDGQSGQFRTTHVDRGGPTVLITTAVRSLGDQLTSRMFTVEMAEGQDQVRAALRAQAKLELYAAPQPNSDLISFQAYLQAAAPWDVFVPFAGRLSDEVGRSPSAPRILRDFARLISLVKSVALLRHVHRQRDDKSRIVAELADYAYVYRLLSEVYSGAASGAGAGVRRAVQAVADILEQDGEPDDQASVTVTKVGERLGISKMQASRYVRAAIEGGWLTNSETRRGWPFKLQIGEPLPPQQGLPSAEVLAMKETVTP